MSSKVIANPVAVLGFKDAGFSTGFSDALKTFGGFSSSFGTGITGMVGQVAKLTGIGSLIGGVLGGIGVGALVHSQMEAIDSTAKLSDRIGIATESLVGLEHAANLSGVSTESLTGGLEKLLKNMADAAQGGKETAAAFKSLGLDAKELVNLPTDTALGIIADKLNAVTNVSEKAALTTKLFGKAGQGLLPLLAEGSAGLKKYADDAEALGISFSRVDASKVEGANDAITRLLDVFKGIATQIGIAISPGVKFVADEFTAMGEQVVTIVKNVLPPIIDTLGSAFGAIVTYVSPAFDWLSSNADAIFGGVAKMIAANIVVVEDVYSGFWSLTTAVFGGIASVFDWTVQTIGQGVAAVIDWFGGDVPSVLNGTASTIQIIGAYFAWLGDTILDVFGVAAYTIKNWQLVVEIAGLTVAANVVTMGNQIAYVLTEVVPGYLNWFADNWSNIFTDVANFTSSVFTNMGSNIGNFFTALWSAMKGDGFNFKWTGLLDGFTATVKELPKIAEREIGPLEQGLNDELAKSEQAFTDGLAAQINKQGDLTSSLAKTLHGITQATHAAAGAAKAGAPVIGAFDGSDSDKAGKSAKDEGTAIRAGSAEALSLRDAFFDGGDAGDFSTDVASDIAPPAGVNFNGGSDDETASRQSPADKLSTYITNQFGPDALAALSRILEALPTADATA